MQVIDLPWRVWDSALPSITFNRVVFTLQVSPGPLLSIWYSQTMFCSSLIRVVFLHVVRDSLKHVRSWQMVEFVMKKYANAPTIRIVKANRSFEFVMVFSSDKFGFNFILSSLL